jgi:hypothetical protein
MHVAGVGVDEDPVDVLGEHRGAIGDVAQELAPREGDAAEGRQRNEHEHDELRGRDRHRPRVEAPRGCRGTVDPTSTTGLMRYR